LRHLGWFAVLGRRGTIGAQVAEVGCGSRRLSFSNSSSMSASSNWRLERKCR
jgi:hypothetical protein